MLIHTHETVRPSLAWGVHLFTASGVLLGFLGLWSALEGDFATAFLWLLGATVVDAVDGFLARAVRVEEVLPQIDGRRLDDLVDFVTYVVVPAFIMVKAGLLSRPELAGFPLMASALGFSNQAAKTQDHYFLGFPSYWNIVALYLWSYQAPPWLAGLVVIILSALVLVPIRYIYPTRTAWGKPLTLILSALWTLQLLWLLLHPGQGGWLLHLSLVYPLYYLLASLYLHFRKEPQ
jgi:phosphatidylcholine synthase